jgi:hypothetical protein
MARNWDEAIWKCSSFPGKDLRLFHPLPFRKDDFQSKLWLSGCQQLWLDHMQMVGHFGLKLQEKYVINT